MQGPAEEGTVSGHKPHGGSFCLIKSGRGSLKKGTYSILSKHYRRIMTIVFQGSIMLYELVTFKFCI